MFYSFVHCLSLFFYLRSAHGPEPEPFRSVFQEICSNSLNFLLFCCLEAKFFTLLLQLNNINILGSKIFTHSFYWGLHKSVFETLFMSQMFSGLFVLHCLKIQNEQFTYEEHIQKDVLLSSSVLKKNNIYFSFWQFNLWGKFNF